MLCCQWDPIFLCCFCDFLINQGCGKINQSSKLCCCIRNTKTIRKYEEKHDVVALEMLKSGESLSQFSWAGVLRRVKSFPSSRRATRSFMLKRKILETKSENGNLLMSPTNHIQAHLKYSNICKGLLCLYILSHFDENADKFVMIMMIMTMTMMKRWWWWEWAYVAESFLFNCN